MIQFTINGMCKETNKITEIYLYPDSNTLEKNTFMNGTRKIIYIVSILLKNFQFFV